MSRMAPGAARDRTIVAAVCRWFDANARPLPWRTPVRDPYVSLVSEFMLQQTQVSRVLQKFGPFLDRFPTVSALAAADEQAVMAGWSGLGYYRRARNLHAAAKEIVSRFGASVPQQARELASLPGVGRYTAGAVASIVFGRAEPIVDGNVARVLMRVEGQDLSPVEGVNWSWGRAAQLVESIGNVGPPRRSRCGPRIAAFNEGLMELGAAICTPRAARCGDCPIRRECRAFARGTVASIPRPKKQVKRVKLFCAAVVLRDAKGRVLVERRRESGMWGGLWQVPTLEGRRRASRSVIERWIGVGGLKPLERFEHGTTHRDVEFETWQGVPTPRVASPGRVWATRAELDRLGLSNAQERILLGDPPRT